MVEEALKYNEVESVLESGEEEDIFSPEYFEKLSDVKMPATKLELLIKMLRKQIKEYGKINQIAAKTFQRSRNKVSRDINISAETEKFLSTITSATGLRRNELCKITGDSLRYDSSGRPFLHITRGTKGGKIRDAIIMGATQEETDYVVSLFKSAGKMKLLPKISSAYDNHRYRAEYAKRLYQRFARNIDDIPKKERIYLRKDRKGEILRL